ncbi:MAG: type II CAAX endopeptidase family protein [Pseudomonadota bacterium]
MAREVSIEAALAPHPLNAIYWSMIALVLYAVGAWTLVGLFYPTGEGGDADLPLGHTTIISTLIAFALLARLCGWAEKVTGTPFAGSLYANSNWLGAAALSGPIVLTGSFLIIGSLLGGDDPNWAYNDSANTDFFTKANIGVSMMLYVLVLAPLIEEISFRGIALGCLLGRGAHPYVAIVITALGFAALHTQYSPLGLLAVFVTGVFLGWLRVASGTISVPIAAHMAANTVSLWFLWMSPDAV